MSNMYIYNVGWDSKDEHEFTQLLFREKLTKRRLSNYIKKATINAFRQAVEHEEKIQYWGTPDNCLHFKDVYPLIIEEMGKLGFQRVKFDAEWGCSGESPLCISEVRLYDTPNFLRLRAAIPEDLKQRAIEISRKHYVKRRR